MTNRHAFEALDRSLKDITGVDLSFGGKIMILGGDFCKFFILCHTVQNVSNNGHMLKAEIWGYVRILRLKQNMLS